MECFDVGSVKVVPLVQLTYLVEPRRFFSQVETAELDPSAWYLQDPYVDRSSGRLRIDMGGFLVMTPERRILVDLGIGNGKSRPNPVFDHRDDPWFDQLRAAGTHPEQVDTVVFTHLHLDHVGNATVRVGEVWKPSFPQARYLTTADEFRFWTSEQASREFQRLGDYVADSVLPLRASGQLDIVPADYEVSEEVRLTPAPGHTPGNVCVEIRSGGSLAVFCGDMVHHPLQLAFPDWSTNFCIDADRAAASRRDLLERMSDTRALLIPAHFPYSSPCRVYSVGDSFWAELIRGNER